MNNPPAAARKLFIGVDIGTQGVKAAVYDSDGACLGEAFRKSELLYPAPDAVEEDPARQVRSACDVIAECAARAAGKGAVRALAIDGQMAGVVGVDDDGLHVTPYDSWLDTRCAPWIDLMRREAGGEILRKTGGPPSINHGPKILWWKHERPELFARIRAFVQPAGYAAMRLCGLDGSRAFIDASYLHFSGFADAAAGAWDAALCRRFGVEQAMLPRIVASHEVIGELVPSMAAACGLRAGLPVIAGCGDTAASFLSCGATRPGICVDVAGTASVFAATVSEPRTDAESMILSCGRSAVPGLWHPYAYVNGGGMNLDWFREQIAGGMSRAALLADNQRGTSPGFDQLNEMASSVTPAEDDPMFIPHLGGRVSPSQPRMRGAWVGLGWRHGAGHLFRAVLEGVALEYGIYVLALESLYGTGVVKEVRVTGGGEKSAVWNRIKADTLGVPITQVMGTGGAPLGSALLAGYGEGTLRDIEGACAQWIRTGPVTEPDPGRLAACRRRIKRYAALLASLNDWEEKCR